MIPIQIVRYTPDAPCTLQGTAAAWSAVMRRFKQDGNPRVADRIKADIQASRPDGPMIRLALDPVLAGEILRKSGIG